MTRAALFILGGASIPVSQLLPAGRQAKLSKARSRLVRSRFLQVNSTNYAIESSRRGLFTTHLLHRSQTEKVNQKFAKSLSVFFLKAHFGRKTVFSVENCNCILIIWYRKSFFQKNVFSQRDTKHWVFSQPQSACS